MKNKKIYKLVFVLFDIILLAISMSCSLLLAQSMKLFELYIDNLYFYGLCLIIISIIIYQFLGLYNSLWKYASVSEGIRIIIATIIIFVLNIATAFITNFMPVSWTIIHAMISLGFLIITRFSPRLIRHYKLLNYKSNIKNNNENVLIVGAGDAAEILIKEMQQNPEFKMNPICLVDDDESKLNKRILNIRVLGNRYDIPKLVEKNSVSLIIVAIPSANHLEISKIYDICQSTKVKVKTLSGLDILNSDNVSVKQIRDVEVQDLLGRSQIKVNLQEIMDYVKDKVCLVTGGGGSIGSELCRQIIKNGPKKLIIFDIYENNAYAIEQELRREYPNVDLLVLIGSVRDKVKIDDLFNKYHPDIVYHAAAHKHVPLMETSPNEAVKNNVFGTLNVAQSADKYGTKRFILISTDKAVNPTNIMGATKRICEMIVQTINKKSNTEFVAVRFGNVLGSNGSVIPLFKEQIKKGGPVTVTHENITRFFMTIPEAVSLVLQAGAFAKGGEIFVLDMGSPVRIYDLAYNLIKLSGFTPNVDIEIKVTGLRPGEKLYEELLMDEEGLQDTPNHLIHIGKPIELDEDNLFKKLDELYEAAYNETDSMKKLVAELVDTYKVQK